MFLPLRLSEGLHTQKRQVSSLKLGLILLVS